MKNKPFLLVSIFLVSITLNSCGVMFGGSKYDATILAKDHPNAVIYVNGEKAGKGAVTGSYYRNQPLEVELKQDGCEEHKKTFHKTFRTGNFILSALTWGIVGMAVDLGTGAAFKPDNRNEKGVTQKDSKNYVFTVEFPDCKN